MNKAALIAILAFTSSVTFAAESCDTSDPGYPWSTAHVEFQKNVSSGYCRVVGDRPSWFIRCSVDDRKTGGCKTIESSAVPDMGYEGSQYWADKNDDGYIDFCREAGNKPGTFTRRALGPEFNKEKDLH